MGSSLTHSQGKILQYLLVSIPEAELSLPESLVIATWPIYHSRVVDKPDDVVIVVGTQGRQAAQTQYGQITEFPGIQLTIRSTNGDVGHAKAKQLCDVLDNLILDATVVVLGYEYLVNGVHRTSPIIPLGFERDSTREIFTVNAIASIKQRT